MGASIPSHRVCRRWAVLLAVGWCLGCGAEAAQSADPLAEETVTVVIPRPVQTLDPRFIRDPYGIKVSRLIFRSLFAVDPENLGVRGDLAIDHTFDGRELRIALDPDARFHDGSALDAEDVVATLRALVDPEVDSTYAGTFRRIAEVRAEGPQRVVIRLDAPHATLLTDLEIPILRAEDAYAPARMRLADGSFVGSGPYGLARQTTHQLILTRRSNDTTIPASLRFVVVQDDNGRALRLQAGGADIALNAIPPLLLPMFENDPDFSVHGTPGVGTSYLGMHMESGLLANGRLRRAIAMAIDRPLLVETELGDRATLAQSWIPENHWADAEIPAIPYDPQEARRIVREVGAEGAALVLRTSTDRGRISICRAIAAMLGQIGLRVQVRPSESATLIADLNAGRFDLTYLQVPEVFEPHVLSWFFGSDRIPENGQRGANRWRLRDSALDALLEEGRTASTRAARVAAYMAIQRRLADQLPVVPLWQEHNVAVVRRAVRSEGAPFCPTRDGRFSHFRWPTAGPCR